MAEYRGVTNENLVEGDSLDIDGDGDLGGDLVVGGNLTCATFSPGTLSGDLMPDVTATRSIGSLVDRWLALYLSGAMTAGSAVISGTLSAGASTLTSLTVSGAGSFGSIGSALVPDLDVTRNLGSSAKHWQNLYVNYIEFPAGGTKQIIFDPVDDNVMTMGNGTKTWALTISGADMLVADYTNRLFTVAAELQPDADNTRDLGDGVKRFKDLYLRGSAFFSGLTASRLLSLNSGGGTHAVAITNSSANGCNSTLTVSAGGDLTLAASNSQDIQVSASPTFKNLTVGSATGGEVLRPYGGATQDLGTNVYTWANIYGGSIWAGNCAIAGGTLSVDALGHLTLSGLTATTLMATNASKQAQSVTITNANGCNASFAGSTLTCTMTQDLRTTAVPIFSGVSCTGAGTPAAGDCVATQYRLLTNAGAQRWYDDGAGYMTLQSRTGDMIRIFNSGASRGIFLRLNAADVFSCEADTATNFSWQAFTVTTGPLTASSTTDASTADGTTGAVRTLGGASIAKKLYVGSTSVLQAVTATTLTTSSTIASTGLITASAGVLYADASPTQVALTNNAYQTSTITITAGISVASANYTFYLTRTGKNITVLWPTMQQTSSGGTLTTSALPAGFRPAIQFYHSCIGQNSATNIMMIGRFETDGTINWFRSDAGQIGNGFTAAGTCGPFEGSCSFVAA